MGNSYSDLKNTLSSKQQVPKHLKPLNKKKKKKQLTVVELTKNSAAQPAAAAPKQDLNHKDIFPPNKTDDKYKYNNVPMLYSNDDDSQLAEEETQLVGSGPRGAFRWFKGRRYLNYATKGGLNNNLLPNDQLELDRMRVLSFIIRWAFKGNVVAPVEDGLKAGIKVLNVGFGPGMWTGHDIIDMAMDHRNSQFTAVDVIDLLPSDFEKSQQEATNEIYYNNKEDKTDLKELSVGDVNTTKHLTPPSRGDNMTLFTPMHPKLSLKLQNTTTLVTDSSLDSSNNSTMLLSQIDEEETRSYATNTTAVTDDMINEEEDGPEVVFGDSEEETEEKNINGVASADVLQGPKHRKLLPNLDFYQVNVVDAGLPFEDNTFDFVMQRLVTASYTVSNWKSVIAELVRVTKPGGYIQLLENDYNTFNLGPQGKKWEAQLLSIARLKRQMEPRIARNLPDILNAVGLIDVSSKLVSIPLGSWGLDLGNLWKHNTEMFADSASPLLSKLAGMSTAEYRAQWHTLFEEAKDRKTFTNIHAAWARKPDDYSLDPSTIDWSSVPPLM